MRPNRCYRFKCKKQKKKQKRKQTNNCNTTTNNNNAPHLERTKSPFNTRGDENDKRKNLKTHDCRERERKKKKEWMEKTLH